jgi:pyridoxine 5-phosphate synthase
MTRLSVNINKVATLRNARGGNNPDVVQVALDCERFGAEGITVHPRPDERHIRTSDVEALSKVLRTELNIEGFPDERYMRMVATVKPAQATLVPDPPHVLTSNAGWNIIENRMFLQQVIGELKLAGCRVSLFIAPEESAVEAAKAVGADCVELYTEPYAASFHTDKVGAVLPYARAGSLAKTLGLQLNAGHDLSLENLAYLKAHLPQLDEVSIGHALICDALYYGLENVIGMYKRKLQYPML